jgi:hypothetical protein
MSRVYVIKLLLLLLRSIRMCHALTRRRRCRRVDEILISWRLDESPKSQCLSENPIKRKGGNKEKNEKEVALLRHHHEKEKEEFAIPM